MVVVFAADDLVEFLAFAVEKFVVLEVVPAHCFLDRFIELSKGVVAWHSEATPDKWFDVVEEDLDGEVFCGRHDVSR